jgi:hypothetical protein
VENINTTSELDVIKVGGFLSGILVSKMIKKNQLFIPKQINLDLLLSNSRAGTLLSYLSPKMMDFRHSAPNYI